MTDTTTLVALAQLQPELTAAENLAKAQVAIAKAARRGASLVVLPEIFMAWLSPENLTAAYAYEQAQSVNGPFVEGLAQCAREHRIWVISGMLERAPLIENSNEHQKGLSQEADRRRVYNTTVVLDDQGTLVTYYRKTHLYDAFGYRESDVFVAGNELFTPIETPFGRLGLFVCYELRFPEVARYQAQNNVDFFVVPSGWVNGSLKEHHWRNLVTTRALENTAYLLACDLTGHQYLGRSLAVDPLGVILAEGSEEECMLYTEIDLARIRRVRAILPSLTHRRPELY